MSMSSFGLIIDKLGGINGTFVVDTFACAVLIAAVELRTADAKL
jgi:hypothetical protein